MRIAMSRIVQDVTFNRPPQDVWRYITDFPRVQVAYDLEAAALGSRLTLSYEIAGRGMYKLVELLTARSIRGSLPNACVALKRNIEAAQAGGTP
jgi:hypothetical protein